MKFLETSLQGAYVIEASTKQDGRGMFARVFCKNEFSKIGHRKEFVQFNHSRNISKGTLRGMHFQKKPFAEIKLIRCIRGAAFDAIIDLRQDSKTFLKWFGEIISAENMKSIYVPEGFAHGFQTLEDNTELLYQHTEFYKPEFEGGVNLLDKTIDIKWPLEISLISDKDKAIAFIDEKYIFF